MCGRFTLHHPTEALLERFDIGGAAPALEPRYNIAPTQNITVVREDKARALEAIRWGLVPSWAKDAKRPLINVRAETLAEKPYFRTALARRRCLVPASGFYEWREADNPDEGGKTPIYFQGQDGDILALAGIWDARSGADEGGALTCAIVTTEPNALLGLVHDRMPVIVPRDKQDFWLNTDTQDVADLLDVLRPFPDAGLRGYPVSRAVNSAAYDDPACILPAGEALT